jgi:hypothetical protein
MNTKAEKPIAPKAPSRLEVLVYRAIYVITISFLAATSTVGFATLCSDVSFLWQQSQLAHIER